MIEKQGIIDEEHTPPEPPSEAEKSAAPKDLADHVTTRLADFVKEQLLGRSDQR